MRAVLRRDRAGPVRGRLAFDDLSSTSPRTGCAATAATCIWGRPSSGCSILMQHPGRVFRASSCWTRVGADTYVEPRTVDVHVRRLRKALNGAGKPT